jgi:proteasome accessory factor B
VVIHFDREVAHPVAEVNWHRTQETEFLLDGRLEFRVAVDGLEEISWWILGYGDRAVVIQPPELRDLIRTHAENLVRIYDSSAETK